MKITIKFPDDASVLKLTMETILNLDEGHGYINANGVPTFTYVKEIKQNPLTQEHIVNIKIHHIYASTHSDDNLADQYRRARSKHRNQHGS